MNMQDEPDLSLAPDQTLQEGLTRLCQYQRTMAITFGATVANLWLILAYGDAAGLPEKLAIAVSVVSIAAFGALGGKSALEDVKALIDDHLDTKPTTRYSRNMAKQPMRQFIALTVALIALAAVVQLWALFA